jgi:hypothetical protein
MRSDKELWIRKRQILNGYIDHSCVRQRRRTSCSGSQGYLHSHFSILCNICMMTCIIRTMKGRLEGTRYIKWADAEWRGKETSKLHKSIANL